MIKSQIACLQINQVYAIVTKWQIVNNFEKNETKQTRTPQQKKKENKTEKNTTHKTNNIQNKHIIMWYYAKLFSSSWIVNFKK